MIPTANLVYDLNASSGTTASGGTVSSWAPQAGSVTDPSIEGTAGLQPLLRVDDEGAACLVFPQDSSRRLALPSGVVFDNQAMSIWIVASITANSQQCFVSGTGWPYDIFGLRLKDGVSTMWATITPGVEIIVPVNKGIYGVVAGPASSSFHSVSASETTGAIYGNVTSGGGYIGCAADGSSFPGSMRLYRLLIYSATQSPSDVIATKAALVAEHNLVTTYAKRVVFKGDSLTFEYGPTEGRNLTYRLDSAVKRSREIFNFGVPGNTLDAMISDVPTQISAAYDAGKECEIVLLGGTNNMTEDPAVAFGKIQTFCANARTGHPWDRIRVCTIPDNGHRSNAIALNDLIRAGDASYDDVEDFGIGSLTETRLSNSGDATYFFDGVHQTDAGSQVKADFLSASLLPTVTVSTSESTLERGQSGQTLHVTLTGATSSDAADFTLTGSAITGLSNGGATPILTVSAATSTGTKTLTHTPSGATTTLTVTDTAAPDAPSPSIGVVSSYAFTLSWYPIASSPSGETITYDVKKNGSTVSAAQVGVTYSVIGAVDGDLFAVIATDSAGNASSAGSATFTAPTSGGRGGTGALLGAGGLSA